MPGLLRGVGGVRLLDRVLASRQQGYYEGMASGAAVLMTFGADDKREMSIQNLFAAAQQAYATNGVVFACVLVRMMLLSEATFKFRTLTDKKLYGTEDVRILEYPYPNGNTSEMVARIEQDVSMAGNAYWWKANRRPVGPPAAGGGDHRVAGRDRPWWWHVQAGLGLRLGSAAGDGGGADGPTPQTFLTVDEVAHCRPIPDPLAKVRGMSWLTPVLKEVTADSGMTQYKQAYMDHGTPIGAVRYAQKLRPDTVDAVQERVMAKYGGVANAWRPLILDQGADLVAGSALKDLDFRAVQAGGETRICAAAGVPPVVIGLRDAEPGESYQTAMRRFGDLTARPLWRSMCAGLEKFVTMPAKGVQLWYDTSDIAALQAAETEKAQVTQVSAAATLTFVQAGFTRESVVSAVTAGDLSLLVPDPNAPTPGIVERETITGTSPFDTAGAVDPADKTTTLSTNGRPAVAGVPPGGNSTLTQAQTAASKKPQPASFPTSKTVPPIPSGTRSYVNGFGPDAEAARRNALPPNEKGS